MGFIIMEPEDTPPMSGSNSICVATVLLDTGIVPMTEPETRLVLEAPGGLVEVVAQCRNGKAERITVHQRAELCRQARRDARGRGPRHADGRHRLWRRQLRHRRCAGARLRDRAGRGARARRDRHPHHPAANEQLGFTHPTNADWNHISFCQIAAPVERARRHADGGQCRRHPARQDRPLADRHRRLGAHGGAARQGRDAGRRPLSRAARSSARSSSAASRPTRRSAASRRSSRRSRAAPGSPARARKCSIPPIPGRRATSSPTPGRGSAR